MACLYFSEEARTADAEYADFWRGTPGENQPKLFFQAEVSFGRILDFADPRVGRALGVGKQDHVEVWRLATSPTHAQEIGHVLHQQDSIAAVRYPSSAALKLGRRGWNVAIFPAAIRPPDRVAILGDGAVPLEVLPTPA